MAAPPVNISSIALALNGKSASVDIPKPLGATTWIGKESFATVAAKSLPEHKRSGSLPTPPNSLSPSLPPVPQQAIKERTETPLTPPAAPNHVDSDIDLHEADGEAKGQDAAFSGPIVKLDHKSLADLNSEEAITPALLAKHHIPRILLEQGPLAMRHLIGFLTTTVPGFSGIPPSKQRRLVGVALEGKRGDGGKGGPHGEVKFEKVGWGKWRARRRGQAGREDRSSQPRHASPAIPASHSTPSQRLQVPKGGRRPDYNRDLRLDTSAGDSATYSHDSDMRDDTPLEDSSMPEHEADKMSLDGDGSCPSDAPHFQPTYLDDLGEETDEEDWASIGAEALRSGSYPRKPRTAGPVRTNHLYPFKSRGLRRPSPMRAGSMPMPSKSAMYNNTNNDTNDKQLQEPANSQERAAVEALLSLGSV